MTADDHVRSIHVFNEKNPQPNIGNFYVGSAPFGRKFSTRIRLADSQRSSPIAQLSDGSFCRPAATSWDARPALQGGRL